MTVNALSRPGVVEHHGRAMGSTLHVIVVSAPTRAKRLIDQTIERVAELESRWSRFEPDSEISMLNARAGSRHKVSADTLGLVAELVGAWTWSDGAFDPTVAAALSAHGYDRPISEIGTISPVPGPVVGGCCGDIEIDNDDSTVRLPLGTQIDPGGLGKGLAADLVVAELRTAGADGALVSIGGDLRCDGLGPTGSGWSIEVGEPMAGVPLEVLDLERGGIATSTPARRRWRTEEGSAHHLIDPFTGRPALAPPAAVSVIAARASDAEWMATAITACGPSLLHRVAGDFTVVITDVDGRRIEHGPIAGFRR